MADAILNFAYSTVATAPSPATSGTSLVVASGDGSKFVVGNAVVWPAGVQPTTANAEIVRITSVVTDTFNFTRTQEGTTAQSIAVGWQIQQGVTAGLLAQYLALSGGTMTGPLTLNADPTTALGAATKEYADATIPYDALVASLNPSAWWKLSDPVGSTTAADSSGNGHTGTATGGVTFGQPGPITGTPSDTAALFDGSTCQLALPSPTELELTYPLSFGAVINTTAPAATTMFVVGKTYAYALTIFNGQAAFHDYGSGSGYWTAGPAINDGIDHHLEVAIDASGVVTLYVDGISYNPGRTSYIYNIGAYGWSIGWEGGYASYFSGKISEATVFPTALTPSQISALYNAAPKYGLPAGGVVTTPSVTSGTAFIPSSLNKSTVYFQLNAAAAGSYTLTMGPATGAEFTVASAVAMVAGSDELVSLAVPASWSVVLTLTTATLGQVRVVSL